MRVGRLITLNRRWLLLPLSPTSPATYFALAVGTGSSRQTSVPTKPAVLPRSVQPRRAGRCSLSAIVLSIVSLGMIDAIAMLPLSISATATSGSALRGPLLVVVVFGVGCCTLLVVGGRLSRLPLLWRSRRLRTISEHVARHTTTRGCRDATVAWFYLFACWSTRAFGSAALLTALGLSFSPTTALSVICLAAAAGVIPITSGGVVVGAGATAGILLALGVGKDIAINFSLASGLLLVTSALAAALMGVLASLATRAMARRNPGAGGLALVPITTVNAHQ